MQIKKSIIFPLVYLSLAALLSACATNHPIGFSFEQLGSDVTERECGKGDTLCYTSINVHGLGTPKMVGGLTTVPVAGWWQTHLWNKINPSARLPDLLAIPIGVSGVSSTTDIHCQSAVYATGASGVQAMSSSDTSIIVQTYNSSLTTSGLGDYIKAMDDVAANYAKIAALESKNILLQVATDYASGVQVPPANAASISAKLSQKLNLPNSFTQQDIQTQQNLLDAEIGVQIASAVSAQETLRNIGNTANVWVWRWDADSQMGGNLNAVDAANVSVASKNKKGGYMIVSGLRIDTLQPGTDFESKIQAIEMGLSSSNFADADGYAKNIFLVTEQFSAQELAFKEDADIENAFALSADFKLADLGDGLVTRLADKQLKVAYDLHAALQAGTRGITKRKSVELFNYAEYQQKQATIIQTYNPFYTQSIEFEKLAKRFPINK